MDATEVKVGDKIPSITLMEGTPDFGKTEVDIAALIAGKKVAIFGVPGAFTPGCSKSHLPSFIEAQQELKDKGVDMTICIATNDSYVMEAWGQVVTGIRASCQPTNAVAKVRRCDPLYLALVCTAESWKEEERLVSGVRHFERWENMCLSMADLLAVLELDKTLLCDVIWKNFGKNTLRNDASTERK